MARNFRIFGACNQQLAANYRRQAHVDGLAWNRGDFMSPYPVAFDPWATSLAAAQANVLASSRAQVAMLNENIRTIYLSKFNDWKISVDAGKIDNSNPPQPPKAYTLRTSVEGFAFPELGDDPVCAMPPVPQDRSRPQPQPVSVGNDQVQNVPPGDHFPVGFELTAPDGGRWQKQASPTPFGTAFYYARVA
jgi:hypothetical protein